MSAYRSVAQNVLDLADIVRDRDLSPLKGYIKIKKAQEGLWAMKKESSRLSVYSSPHESHATVNLNSCKRKNTENRLYGY
jgi:hypothetical protein